jgi:hypothetical protein
MSSTMFGSFYKLYSSLFHLGRQRPPLVLGHIFFVIFSFRTSLASVLLFVSGSRLHFHSIDKHTLRMCNIYCFFNATVIERNRFNVTLSIHFIYRLFLKSFKNLHSHPRQSVIICNALIIRVKIR